MKRLTSKIRKWFQNREDAYRKRTVVPIVLLSAVFGLAAGAVGMLLSSVYLLPNQVEPSQQMSVSGLPKVQWNAGGRVSVPAVKDVSASVAAIYKSEDVTGYVFPERAVGQAAVLTSDGWIVSHQSVPEASKRTWNSGLTVIVDGKQYAIKEAVADTFTGVAFLKLDAANLPIAMFGNSDGVAVGEALFSVDAARGVSFGWVMSAATVPAADEGSAVRSSEKFQRALRLSGTEDFGSGTPLFNSSGEVIGIVAGKGKLGSVAVPVNSVMGQVATVLRDKSVSRPLLGVRFVDLSDQPVIGGGTLSGAKLTASGKSPAVVRQSPAAKTGLREGDVIVSVNDDLVSANRSLPELLVEYAPDETVTVKYRRGQQELSADVVLGKAVK